jgi:hypothetical protein
MATHRKGPSERRFVKLPIAVWNDPRVLALSEKAQHLLMRLLTGPETLRIPGLVAAKKNGLALDRLGWDLEEFDRRFDELSAQGLVQADWQAGVLFFEESFLEEFNQPTSINTVKCWRRELLNALRCELVEQVSQRLRQLLASKRNPNWLAAFNGQALLKLAKKQPSKLASSMEKKASSLPTGIPDPDPDLQPLTGLLPPNSAETAGEELEDLTHLAEDLGDELDKERGPQASLTRQRPSNRPSRRPAASPTNQTYLALMPPPDPERCAAVLQEASGRAFAYGPLRPLSPGKPNLLGAKLLGGWLHPSIRDEWARVLHEYFAPLNMTVDQIDSTLSQLGQFIKARGETVVLHTLTKWRGERLHELMARALAWDGTPPVGQAREAEHGSRYRPPEDELARRRGSGQREPQPLSAAEHLRTIAPRPPVELTQQQREWAVLGRTYRFSGWRMIGCSAYSEPLL